MIRQDSTNQLEQSKKKHPRNLIKKDESNLKQVEFLNGQKFEDIIFTKNDFFLFFKYIVCKKWNKSPILLFDAIQKKLLSVEHLYQIHSLLLSLKTNADENNLMDNYKFFYE